MRKRVRGWKTMAMTWKGVTALAFGMCLLFAIGMWINAGDLRRASQMEIDRSRQLTEMQVEAAQLQAQLNYIGSDEDIEHRARLEHNYMKVGETRFHIENADSLHNYTMEQYQEKIKFMQADTQ